MLDKISYIHPVGWMDESGRIWEGDTLTYFRVPSFRLLGGTEETKLQ
jgi:hypothetical protein